MYGSDDPLLGVGKDGQGQNLLGKMLMEIRDKSRRGYANKRGLRRGRGRGRGLRGRGSE